MMNQNNVYLELEITITIKYYMVHRLKSYFKILRYIKIKKINILINLLYFDQYIFS